MFDHIEIVAACGLFTLGCAIAAMLPRPVELDKRAWGGALRRRARETEKPPARTRSPARDARARSRNNRRQR